LIANELNCKVVKDKELVVLAVFAMRRRPEHSTCSRYYYKKCSDLGEINCTAGRVVIWFEMGGLEGIGRWRGLTERGEDFYGFSTESR
jgi:hypothetical protein